MSRSKGNRVMAAAVFVSLALNAVAARGQTPSGGNTAAGDRGALESRSQLMGSAVVEVDAAMPASPEGVVPRTDDPASTRPGRNDQERASGIMQIIRAWRGFSSARGSCARAAPAAASRTHCAPRRRTAP